ncbi:MAG: hypothetical protein FWE60_04040, partial [Oscillospiraceae bacterium]|nr:hypothetical protein [Oscillospiraceae bacterium]
MHFPIFFLFCLDLHKKSCYTYFILRFEEIINMTLLLIYPDFLEEDKFNRNKRGSYSEGLA